MGVLPCLIAKARGTVDFKPMVWKAILTFAFMAALLPHEPDIGFGHASARAVLEPAHVAILAALDRVRADLKAHGVHHYD